MSTPSNPPIGPGWKLMQQSEVTAAMTNFAVELLHDQTLVVFDEIIRTFAVNSTVTKRVLARIEWHPPDFNNGQWHRGVTLYEPTP